MNKNTREWIENLTEYIKAVITYEIDPCIKTGIDLSNASERFGEFLEANVDYGFNEPG